MNNNILCNRGYKIPLIDISCKQLESIIKELTVTPNTMMCNNKDEDTSFKLYKLNEKYIIVPKYYGIEKFGKPDIIKYNPTTTKMKFKLELRDYQKPIINKCIAYLNQHDGGLLSLPCGLGKTALGLKMACELGYKTLVVVHKSFLLDQWKDRINQFTDAKIGIIRQDTVDVEDKDIVIAMIQSLSKRNYERDIFEDFGTVIYDESHHCASKHFSKSLIKTSTKYTISLSATPHRNDGLIKVMHWFLGKTMFKIKMKDNDQVVAKIINFHSSDKDFKNRERFIKGEMRADCVKMETYLTENNDRNKHLIDIINELRKDNNRKILILSGRKDHLKLLKEKVDKSIKLDIENELIDENHCKTRYYTGDLKQEERFDAEENGDILFGTYSMAAEGLDVPKLNCIILATPKKDVVQSIGRVMRKVLQDGDLRPLIIDFKDSLNVYKNQGDKREALYKRGKYNIEHYYISDKEFVKPKDYTKITEIEVKENKWIEFSINLENILRNLKVKLSKNYLLQHIEIKNATEEDIDDEIKLCKNKSVNFKKNEKRELPNLLNFTQKN